MADDNIVDLDKRRPRGRPTDRAELQGALWVICQSLDWVRDTAKILEEPVTARRADELAEEVYALADSLN